MKLIRLIVQTALLIVLAVLFGLNTVKAQTEVKGIVTDINRKPLQGVSVLLKGTGNGTSTNIKGHYSIIAPSNGTLVFSFVGFANQEVPVKSKTNIDVQLQVTANALNEVVVTALMTNWKIILEIPSFLNYT
jgi:iron complex outermembrane recepter protein